MSFYFSTPGVINIPIAVDTKGNELLELASVSENEIYSLTLEAPITHALVIVAYRDRILLMFNKYNQCRELPGGVIETGETPRQCAVRELHEETNQTAKEILFKGLMKLHLQPSFHGPERIEFGTLYTVQLDTITDFQENEEAGQIVWWDRISEIGYINEIDKKLTEYV